MRRVIRYRLPVDPVGDQPHDFEQSLRGTKRTMSVEETKPFDLSATKLIRRPNNLCLKSATYS